ncbi:MAG: hypothetical protein RIS64_4082 [Bacteroidota bacterium]
MQGFSKLTKTAKLDWLVQHYFHNDAQAARTFCDMAHKNPELQKIIDGFIFRNIHGLANHWVMSLYRIINYLYLINFLFIPVIILTTQ